MHNLFLTVALIGGMQFPTITGIKLDVIKASDTAVVAATKTYTSNNFQCGQTPSPPATLTVNPTSFEWDDPAIVGKVCKIVDKAFFDSLAAGDYLAKGGFTYSDGSSGGTSLASNPFTRFIAGVPLNLRITR